MVTPGAVMLCSFHVYRIICSRFGCAGSRSIRGRRSLRQIQKLCPALLGPVLVDGDTLKFLLRALFYYEHHR